jgi:pyruvate-ferredoxin/flavodoxin oxidoreductase
VDSGAWILYRYDPRRIAEGKNPLQLDSKEPTLPIKEYMYNEARFRALRKDDPERAERLLELAQRDAEYRWSMYKQMSEMDYSQFGK